MFYSKGSAWQQRVIKEAGCKIRYAIGIKEGKQKPTVETHLDRSYPYPLFTISIGKGWLKKHLTKEELVSFAIDRMKGNK